MAFFTPELFNFLNDLTENNNRDWFHANKKRYETHLKKPFEQLIGAAIDRVQSIDNRVLITPKEAIFRIYRDTRFSNDKTPYKTQLSAVVSKGGRKDMSSPGIYIEVRADHFRLYSGVYMPSTKQLQAIREAIVSQVDEFKALVADKKFKKHFGEIRGEQNKRIPKEFREAAETLPVLMNKQFYYFADLAPETALDPKLVEIIARHYEVAQPLGHFFERALEGAQ